MDYAEIDLKSLRTAVNAVFDHLIEDLRLDHLTIDPKEDFYWECPFPDAYDSSKPPIPDVGRLADDLEFSNLVKCAKAGAASYNLVHLAPLLRYIGEKVKT